MRCNTHGRSLTVFMLILLAVLIVARINTPQTVVVNQPPQVTLTPEETAEVERLQALEGRPPEEEPTHLYKSRARLNLSRDFSTLADYLPHRRIPSSKQPMSYWDQRVEELIPFLDTRVTDVPVHVLYDFDKSKMLRFLQDEPRADFSSKALIASTFVYMTHANYPLLKKLLYETTSLNFVLASELKRNQRLENKKLNGQLCGFHTPGSSINVLVVGCFWQGMVVPHEAAHYLDDADGRMDGLPVLMHPDDAQTLVSLRDGLFEQQQKQPGSTGIMDYAYTNKVEFLATTMELFLDRPVNIRNVSRELYEVYARYFGFYPAE